MGPRLATSLALIPLVAVTAACGAERRSDQRNEAVDGPLEKELAYRAAGMRLVVPDRTGVRPRPRPGVFRLAFPSSAFAAAFVYPRREPLPGTREELVDARRRLVREVRARSDSFRLRSARLTRVDRAPAIELVGDQTLSGSRVRTRSLHVFRGRVEYVIEFFAQPARYAAADRRLFEPVLRSVRLSGRPGRLPE